MVDQGGRPYARHMSQLTFPTRAATWRPPLLWRELVGAELRRLRRQNGQRLVDVADRAGISVQYLSEVERGQKEASSEILESVCGAHGLTVVDLAERIVRAERVGVLDLTAPGPDTAGRPAVVAGAGSRLGRAEQDGSERAGGSAGAVLLAA